MKSYGFSYVDAFYYTKTAGFYTWHDISYRVSQTPTKHERGVALGHEISATGPYQLKCDLILSMVRSLHPLAGCTSQPGGAKTFPSTGFPYFFPFLPDF